LKWLLTRNISAEWNSLWEYVNPDLLPERLKKLEEIPESSASRSDQYPRFDSNRACYVQLLGLTI
jgi:hypothetical protein